MQAIRAMERTSQLQELEKQEAHIMAPRAYVTICGAVLLFVGLFCQLIPFCHLLSELGLPVAFHGFCPLVEIFKSQVTLHLPYKTPIALTVENFCQFVLTSSFMMMACAVLATLGLIWSCTRGWAALVLLSLGLLGDLMLFGGFVSCLIWFVLAGAVLFLYFVFLPGQYADKGEAQPVWVQDLGSFEVDTDLDKMGEAFKKGGQVFIDDLATNPVSTAVTDAAAASKAQIDKLTGTQSGTQPEGGRA